MRVLNAAISSYGTARELLLLKRTQTTQLKYLIIQYCNNDFKENVTYLEHGNSLPVMTQETYEKTVRDYNAIVDYYVLKHSWSFPKYFMKSGLEFLTQKFSQSSPTPQAITSSISVKEDVSPVPNSPPQQGDQKSVEKVRTFLGVLMNAPIDISSVQIIVLEMNSFGRDNTSFVKILSTMIAQNNSYPAFIKNMHVIDCSAQLTPEMFFLLDDHMTAEGHKIVAKALVDVLLR